MLSKFLIFILLAYAMGTFTVLSSKYFKSDSFFIKVFGSLAILISHFFLLSGYLWLICWAFDLTFSWKVAFGINVLIAFIKVFFCNSGVTKERA